MRIFRNALLVAALAACATPVTAAPVLIDFESLSDLDVVTTQFEADGISFTGATALLSGALGGSLNEFDFPPSSGGIVVYDADGTIRVDFLTGALSVGGHFTYVAPVTMTAFAGATVLGSVTSQFVENLASGSNPTNELIQLAFAEGITHITLAGAVGGGSFVLDDFFAETQEGTPPIPEPATITLLLLGGAMIAGRNRINARRSRSAS
jgi:hypothetical protein